MGIVKAKLFDEAVFRVGHDFCKKALSLHILKQPGEGIGFYGIAHEMVRPPVFGEGFLQDGGIRIQAGFPDVKIGGLQCIRIHWFSFLPVAEVSGVNPCITDGFTSGSAFCGILIRQWPSLLRYRYPVLPFPA